MADSENDDEAGGAEPNDANFRIIPPEGERDDVPEDGNATQPDLFSGAKDPAAGKASHVPDSDTADGPEDEAPVPLGGPGPPDNRLESPSPPEPAEPEAETPPAGDAEPGLRTLRVPQMRTGAAGGDPDRDAAAESEPATADSTFEMRTGERPTRSRQVPTKQIRPDAAVGAEVDGESAGPAPPPSVPSPETPPATTGEEAPLIRVIADGDAGTGAASGSEVPAQGVARRIEADVGPAPGMPQELPEPVDARSGVITKVITGLVFGAVALVFIFLGRGGVATLAVILITWVAAEVFILLYRVATPALRADPGALARRPQSNPAAEGVGSTDIAADETAVPPVHTAEEGLDWGDLLVRSPFLVGVAAVAALGVLAYLYGLEAVGILTAAGSLAVVLWFYRPGERPTVPLAESMALTGIVHVGLLGAFALLILRLENGFAIILVTLILAIVFDVASYAWGTAIGTRRLMPDISPNKTLEGLLGGVATTFVAMAVVVILPGSWYEVPFLHSWPDMAALTAAIVVFGILGDLAESLVKRSFGIKDVASFLPGHGGMFDRFDGVLFVLPAAYAVLTVLGVTE
ncbi:MAG: phosphatidate cytidylyltransferase [Acidimicrobiia bacterium]|nr:phosphatidate cytidylyltransferase [Acidimicrobiia bacterium]